MVGSCIFITRPTEGRSMPDNPDIAGPHADRYGHPEGVNLTTLIPGIYDHVVAAPHCDRYGHVEGNDPRQKVADEAIVLN